METNHPERTIRRRLITPNDRIVEPLLDEPIIADETPPIKSNYLYKGYKLRWPWAIGFILFWLALYALGSIVLFHRLPQSLEIKDEPKYPGEFIAENAEMYLHGLVDFGKRVTGSNSNEIFAVEYLRTSIEKIKASYPLYHDIEIDVQVASNSYAHWEMVNTYYNIQNVVAKFSPKNSNSSNYLLLNCHFDSVLNGPGAGDDGVMVAVMLEVLRVLMKSKQTLKHPIIFLFNGAEENPLQGSHAFITGHKWAPYVRAFINLDSAGNGGREILFQSGPNHPWLIKHYSEAIRYPYASTAAEEIFQSGLIPSDTDFRIFRDYGKIPGLDMAHQYNGYVYHTKHDRAEIVPLGTIQNTGDNILSLVRSIANSTELEKTKAFARGHTVFFDIFGLFFISYTERTGMLINTVISSMAILFITNSLRSIGYYTGNTRKQMIKLFIISEMLHIGSIFFGATLCFILGAFMDFLKVPMSWFTNSWLIIGQYYCLLFFGMGIVPALYFHFNKHKYPLPPSDRVQFLLHSHGLLLTTTVLHLTLYNVRSTFVPMVALLFYVISVTINLMCRLNKTEFLWLVPHLIFCVPTFMILSCMIHGMFVAFVPITGRMGSKMNPEFVICTLSVLSGILIAGFLVPVLHLFHKSKNIIYVFLIITISCVIVAFTPYGFPYKPETNVQRFTIVHTQRTLRDINNIVRINESGFLILPQDRRLYTIEELLNYRYNISLAKTGVQDCDTEMFCGLPLYNHRWYRARKTCKWIPTTEPEFNNKPNLLPLDFDYMDNKIIYHFKLTGPEHMTIFLRPLNNVTIHKWSFNIEPLQQKWSPPYFIYIAKGINAQEPIHIELEIMGTSSTNNNLSQPTFEIGVGGHWTFHNYLKTNDFKKFLRRLPAYTDLGNWVASYDTWFF